MAEIFRKSSIEKLSNPEQLDKAIRISSPISWLALLGIALIIVITGIWSVVGTLPTTVDVTGMIAHPVSASAVFSDCAGTVVSVAKKAGEKVHLGDEIASVILSDGTTKTIKATQEGVLTELLVTVDSPVYVGGEVARFTPTIDSDQAVVLYVPVSIAQQLKTDMSVLVYPTSVDTQKYGHMEATIESIGEYPVNTSNMWYVLGTDNLVAEQFVSQGPVVSVICKLKEDTKTTSGYYWSSDNAKELTVPNGVYVTGKVVVDESAPITKLIHNLKDKLED